MATFVAHTARGWQLTFVPARSPERVGLPEVLDLLGPSATSAAVAHDPLDPDEVVQAAWSVIGELTDAGLTGEDAAGRPVVLDAVDLTLVDVIGDPETVGAITDRTGTADAPARLARLLAAGKVRRPDTTPPRRPGQVDRGPQAPRLAPTGTPHPGGPDGRVPVYAVWQPEIGPVLSLGMLTAAARRHDGGALNERFEIRRPETPESFLADLADRTGPAVLLCSDYVWSLDHNLDLARQARSINPELVVLHGGPSSPKYEGDAEAFLAAHGEAAHVLVRGEGEHAIGELLAALGPALPELDADALSTIAGLTFDDPRTGAVVRTPDRERIADLDDLPSAYLTGEYDHIPGEAWWYGMSIETNRGCPYGCTFCDWGSATLSRIRKFSRERVRAELEWGAKRGVDAVLFADANFGILARDVDAAADAAAVKATYGRPSTIAACPAKNTTRHLSQIMDTLLDAGIAPTMSISMQTADPTVLEAIDRSNIATDHYVALAADHRRRGHPLVGDLLVGMPEQTYATFLDDLQFSLDHEILARTLPVQLLPNAPMNDPAYRKRYGIVSDENGMVVATSSFTPDDRRRMGRLRRAFVIMEVYGVLRHVGRWVQWDHGLRALDLIDRILVVTESAPDRYPSLAWLVDHFDLLATAPRGWHALYDEVRRLLHDEFAIGSDDVLEGVLALQTFLMPASGRRFPDTLAMPHDYLAYYREATRPLYLDGHAQGAVRPLAEYGPGELTISDDPLGLCSTGPELYGDGRDAVIQGDFYMGATSAYELLSPLTRLFPHVVSHLRPDEVQAVLPELDEVPAPPSPREVMLSVNVRPG